MMPRSAAALALTAAALAAPPGLAETLPQRPGTVFHISASQLPRPGATPGAANQSQVVARPGGARLTVPAGFAVSLYASGLASPRHLLVLPNGDVLAAEAGAGTLTLLRETPATGTAQIVGTFAAGFERPFGMALHDGALYAGDVNGIYRLGYTAGADKAGAKTMITAPGALGGHDDHWTRNIVFGPDGTLYLAEGSTQNVGIDPLPHAAILTVQTDGTLKPFATGLRNPAGLAFYPGTNTLYTAVNERDMLGNGLVPDYFTAVRAGGFYGWPYAYTGPHPDPAFGAKAPDMVAKTLVPDVLFQSHSAPLGFAFYEASQFPAKYKGDAFVALHGSWNSSEPTGYKVVRVHFVKGKPAGRYENFVTGFWLSGQSPAQVMGRPADVAVAADGGLLICDDAGKAIWKVTYTGAK